MKNKTRRGDLELTRTIDLADPLGYVVQLETEITRQIGRAKVPD